MPETREAALLQSSQCKQTRERSSVPTRPNLWRLSRRSIPMHVTGRTAASPPKTMHVVSQGWTPCSMTQPVATTDAEEASPFPKHQSQTLEKAMCTITEADHVLSDAGNDAWRSAKGDIPGHSIPALSDRPGQRLAIPVSGKPQRPGCFRAWRACK